MADIPKRSNFNEFGFFSNVVKWNTLTTYCYMRKFSCTGCWFCNMLESQDCRVKATALELFKRFGEPPENLKQEAKDYY